MKITTETYAGKLYKVAGGTYFNHETSDDVIQIIADSHLTRRRIRIHYGYTSQADADKSGLGGVVGRDWLEENDVQGRIGRSTGQVKIPLMIEKETDSGGPGILDACIVKITMLSGKVVLYQHPNYHHGKVTLHVINEKHGKGKRQKTYTASVKVDGKTHANFETMEKAQRWVKRMGFQSAELATA